MAITKKEAARALDAEERDLVEKSHHPALQALSDHDLAGLVKLVRARRDKAQTAADQRRREMRGKAAPRGATPSKADAGSRTKVAVLAMAVRRLNSETERRRRMAERNTQVEIAQKALAMKQDHDAGEGTAFNTRHARRGMNDNANQRAESLIRPMERGRLRKAAAVSQAKRDAR